jgi:hypothetical protein
MITIELFHFFNDLGVCAALEVPTFRQSADVSAALGPK